MKSTVFLATIAVVLVLGLAAFVRSRDTSPSPDFQPVTKVPTAPERGTRYAVAAAEAIPAAPVETSTNELAITNLYARLINSDIPRVNREQLDAYLTKHHRSVDALLGALRASGDDALLAEAKEKFPNDPRVQFAAAFKSESPEERRQWFEKLKQFDPDNSLANYLLAGEHLKTGQTDQAFQELTAAAAKRSPDTYLVDFIQNAEEAYRAAGFSIGEAKATASATALLPEQAKLKEVGVGLMELAKRYQQAGDAASAQAVLEMGMNLGRRLEGAPQTTLIQELVGLAIQRLTLNAMNPNAPYGDTGQTVQNQLDVLAARRKSYRELNTESERVLITMSDQELGHFYDRLKMYGETAAMRWVINQAPPK